jgi:hypothetical protein
MKDEIGKRRNNFHWSIFESENNKICSNLNGKQFHVCGKKKNFLKLRRDSADQSGIFHHRNFHYENHIEM